MIKITDRIAEEPEKFKVDISDRIDLKYSEGEKFINLGWEIKDLNKFRFRKDIIHVAIDPDIKWQPYDGIVTNNEKLLIANNIRAALTFLGLKNEVHILKFEKDGTVTGW